MPWLLIAAASLTTFAVTASGSSRAPFIIDMARDLEVGLTLIANLFGITSIAWGISSFLAGMGSDRWGRRPFLIGAPVALAATLGAVATASSFWSVAFWVTVAGGCSGLFTGVSLAEVASRVDDRQRGRALGWVMAGQSMTLLIGVPLAAWIGAGIGWRGVHLAIAGLCLVSAVAMVLTTGGAAAAAARRGLGTRPPSLRSALTAPVVKLLSIVIAERVCFGLAIVYYATFLQMIHGLSLAGVALPLAIFALGNILGTVVGGQLADRLANRMLTFALALLSSGAVALALFGWHPSLAASVVLGFSYVFCNALARPSLMASLAAVPGEVRGTVMGLNSTCASAGWLAAAAAGGWILTAIGFAGFGPFVAVLAVVGAALALAGPRLAVASES